MSRNIEDLMERPWPPVGKIGAVCIEAKLAMSKVKKTPFIGVVWKDHDGEFQWRDDVFCTPKAIRRLALIASHVCGFKDELPDSDDEAMKILEEFILENIVGKSAVVIIEEKQEIFIPESGPNMGRKTTVMKKKVAYNGYEKPVEVGEASTSESPAPKVKTDAKPEKEDDLPF